MLWVKCINDATGTHKKGNYKWEVGVNEVLLASGEVKGHQRAKGWLPLLRKVVRLSAKQHIVNDTQYEGKNETNADPSS